MAAGSDISSNYEDVIPDRSDAGSIAEFNAGSDGLAAGDLDTLFSTAAAPERTEQEVSDRSADFVSAQEQPSQTAGSTQPEVNEKTLRFALHTEDGPEDKVSEVTAAESKVETAKSSSDRTLGSVLASVYTATKERAAPWVSAGWTATTNGFSQAVKRAAPWLSTGWTATTNGFSQTSKYVSNKYNSWGGPEAKVYLSKTAGSIWSGITTGAAWVRDNAGPMMTAGREKATDLWSRAPTMSQIKNDGPTVVMEGFTKGYKTVSEFTKNCWGATATTCAGKKPKED